MKKYLFVTLWIISVILILVFSQNVTEITYKTLTQTFTDVFPVLFPFSVIASLMVSMGGGETIGSILPISKIFLMPVSASAPIICGALCGFPLGAKTACDMYEYGSFSKKCAEKVISVSNNTGPVFIISIIGKKYFKSVEVGLVIYFSQFIAALISSLAINGKINEESKYIKKNVSFCCAFSEAVKSALISCLYICGFISVFSSLLYAAHHLPKGLFGSFSALLEFTSGAKYGGDSGGLIGMFVAAFSVGWSGLSVIMQTITYTYPLGLSIRPLIKIKILSGLICGLICSIYFTPMKIHMICALIVLILLLYMIRCKETIMHKITENSNCS